MDEAEARAEWNRFGTSTAFGQRLSVGRAKLRDRGACFAGVVVTDAVHPGVVRLACGAWYDPASDADDAPCAHGNANVLTRDHGTSRLSQGPSSATALVEVERCAEPPPVRAFSAAMHLQGA